MPHVRPYHAHAVLVRQPADGAGLRLPSRFLPDKSANVSPGLLLTLSACKQLETREWRGPLHSLVNRSGIRHAHSNHTGGNPLH